MEQKTKDRNTIITTQIAEWNSAIRSPEKVRVYFGNYFEVVN